MTEKFDPRKPVIRNRASIVTWSLEVRVYWKHQLKSAIEWLVERDIQFDWEVVIGDSLTLDEFTLVVHEMSWAHNLSQFAKVLEDCDYQPDYDAEDLTYPSFITQILATSKRIRDNRTKYAVLSKAVEELGELSQEVMIANGDHYKEEGKDGIIGEAIDLMVCCTDLIYGVNPDITEEELQELLAKKLAKWVEKSELQNPGSTE